MAIRLSSHGTSSLSHENCPNFTNSASVLRSIIQSTPRPGAIMAPGEVGREDQVNMPLKERRESGFIAPGTLFSRVKSSGSGIYLMMSAEIEL